MRWLRVSIAVVALGATFAVACTDPTGSNGVTTDPNASPSASPLPLAFAGAVLHAGDYCHFLQTAIPGNNTLPVAHGCLFDMTHPADLFATDGNNYSVSEVVGTAVLGVRGPADAKVMVECRLSPRAEFWFWISADAHWNISNAADVHNPQDLVSAQEEEPLRQYVKTGGVQNQLQFMCAGGQRGSAILLAVNMNGHQFTTLTLTMPSANVPLTRPVTPWFVDIGARMITAGHLEGITASVMLYDHE